MFRRRFLAGLARVTGGWLAIGIAPAKPALARINLSRFAPSAAARGTCGNDVCTTSDICASGDAGHTCTTQDACDADASRDCTSDRCGTDSSAGCTTDGGPACSYDDTYSCGADVSGACQSDASGECSTDGCVSDSSNDCVTDRCIADSSGACTLDAGPSGDDECPSDLSGSCISDKSGDCGADGCVSDKSGSCTTDGCVSDSSKGCQLDACLSDSSGTCLSDRCRSDSSGECANDGGPSCPDECLADSTGDCASDASGACIDDACVSDSSGTCLGDGCVADASGHCTSDGCTSDKSGTCTEDTCTSDQSGPCTTDDCADDSAGDCSPDLCVSDSSGACFGADVCVVDASSTCGNDLCRSDQSPTDCATQDTCALDLVSNPTETRRRVARASLNRAIRWLYQLGCVALALGLAGAAHAATVIDARALVASPKPVYATGQSVSVPAPVGPFVRNCDADPALEADTNGDGVCAGDPELVDNDGDGSRNLPPGTPFTGSFQFTCFWVPEDVTITATGPLTIKGSKELAVFGALRLPNDATFSTPAKVDVRASAWLADDPGITLRFNTALTGTVDTSATLPPRFPTMIFFTLCGTTIFEDDFEHGDLEAWTASVP